MELGSISVGCGGGVCGGEGGGCGGPLLRDGESGRGCIRVWSHVQGPLRRVESEETSLVPAEDAVALRLALSSAERLAQLKALRAQHVGCALPAAATLVDREIKQVERSLHAAGSQEGRIVGQQLRTHMDAVLSREMDLLRGRQAAARRRRAAKAKLAGKKRRLARIKKVAAAKQAELKKRLDDLPLYFNHEECGAPGAPGKRVRVQCLERLKLRAPPLPFEYEARWKRTRDAYGEATQLRAVYKLKKQATVGPLFIDEINGVLMELREHYSGKSKYNDKGEVGGDDTAFFRFVQRMEKAVAPPKAARLLEM